ncbi:DNA polymerase-3 subunit delta' [Paenarthrobacter nicotinovorans]|uniref:DNA polymerase-3 subunit delta n=2 Tax=Paenarthrobacter nicotinovorans TaxID=29320 RepID=A0ABT9TPF0_PAENI|nr:DNA polymerase III subunit delta' [Paenarthrobacter nicotinovorans]KQR04389.1 DNA polymerase III subunit delta' [Arthrobacter sp. Leaf145]SKB66361.1 DNA polymerase-3 subunit delta' [Arthrobacter sp. 31Cvi3.1E]BCW09525.1 DNA polymerase III subunit delta' [Arthrobacter sp. NtRootA2]BCW13605.1 DNA polymerase III subunit delta' [Arthrobacter sp. NtRootA4]BCW21941.1 DNA polymerase III subunit delta' [Arthrobacter sp. NtRootC7]BCW26209.1 DNA polymerase III subunit delta' [Arthrobacter sp. NtRoot
MSVWDDLQGQAPVVAQLKQAAQGDTGLTHAWLFTGPPGSGRSNAAKAFAAALNCEQDDVTQRGCGVCAACHTILGETHSDVTFVRTEKVTITIDEARELVSKAGDRPATGRWRIIVVEDADRMAERTTNVLLKAIEEPTPRTIWMLCAPSPADVLVTIRSRCRPVSLRLPPAADVADLLVRRDGVERQLAERAARAAQSHIGIARRLARDADARERRLETVRIPLGLRGVTAAVMMAEKLVKIATEEANSSNDERDAAEKIALLASLGAPESGTLPPSMRSQVKQLEDDQKRRAKRSITDSLDRTLTDLLSFYRDVLIIQLGNAVELVNVELKGDLEEYAGRSTPETTLARMDAINKARVRITTTNVAPLLAVESMATSLIQQ